MSGGGVVRASYWLAIPLGIYLTGEALPLMGGNHLGAAMVGGGAAWVMTFVVRGIVESGRLRREGVPPSRWS